MKHDEYDDDDDGLPVLDENALALKQMFTDRDEDYIAATQEIVNTIGPTLLEALYRLFAVPVENVHWLDFSSSETIMVITCSITYNPSTHVPKFLCDTLPQIPRTNQTVAQTCRIGVPYELILEDPEDILEFFSALVTSHIAGGPTLFEHMDSSETENSEFDTDVSPRHDKAVDAGEFNPSELTPEQKQQLLIFQHQTKGKLH